MLSSPRTRAIAPVLRPASADRRSPSTAPVPPASAVYRARHRHLASPDLPGLAVNRPSLRRPPRAHAPASLLLRLSIPSRSFVDIRLSRVRAVRILRSTSGPGQIPRPEFGLSGRVDRSVPRRSSRRTPRTCAARKCYAVPTVSALDILRTPALAASGKPPLAASASAVPCSPRQR